MKRYKTVILGGGVAAGYAAQAYVEHDGKPGELCIVSADDRPPYERPPLSKGFLTGNEKVSDTLINPQKFYDNHDIDVLLETRVDKVDFDERTLHAGKRTIGFENLLIATGSRIKTLDVPGSDLNQIFYLRTLSDAGAILDAIHHAERAVVVGGSFIGMEVTSSLQQNKIQTTEVFQDDHLGGPFFTPEMARFFEDYYRERGVQLVSGTTATAFSGKNQVESVTLKNGDQIAADLVVIGIGVEPNVDLFKDTPLKVKEGILVDRHLATNIEGVYAVGDVAEYNDPFFGKRRRVEHWDNAMAQGQHAMQNILGAGKPYKHLPYFFSDVFDLSYEFWGDTSDFDQVIHRGDLSDAGFSVWWLKGARLMAAFVLDRPDEEREAAQAWIASGEDVPVEQLQDEKAQLSVEAEPA